MLTTIFVFLLIRLLPGDPVLLYVSMDEFNEVTTEEELAALRHEFGLDRPMYVQYADWISGVVRGDLGESIFLDVAVSEEMGSALPKTMFLGVLAWILALVLGIPFGIIAALRRGKWIDTIVTFMANIGITAPVFWVGIMLIHVFAVTLGWLPVMGYTSIFSDPLLAIKKMIMPIFCLALFPMAGTSRQARSAMLEVIRQDYIRTARAKGLPEKIVIFKHAFRNSLIPIVTLLGSLLPGMFGGSVIIESIFSIPGMGQLGFEAVLSRDYPVVLAIATISAFLTLLGLLVSDLLYVWVDPRISYEAEQ